MGKQSNKECHDEKRDNGMRIRGKITEGMRVDADFIKVSWANVPFLSKRFISAKPMVNAALWATIMKSPPLLSYFIVKRQRV